ncbi:MAG: Bifunctional uridylyltransferase/uridylyl-removing enzyme, partial [Planctomycetota bacterium]
MRDDDLGEAYRGIQRKDLLHLALLLHDLGKGCAEDHSDVGRRVAVETGQLLNLTDHDTELVAFLVHKHLIMSHLAQWRDINDPAVVIQFAVEMGSPEVLKMLYVLTCADLEAVGPGVLTDWKLRLLTNLYHRTMNHLAGSPASDQLTETKKQEVRDLIPSGGNREWWLRQIDAIPPSYVATCDPPHIATELAQLEKLHRR